MKILHIVENYYPKKSGMSEVVKQISKPIHKNGHKITIATGYDRLREEDFHSPIDIEEFKITGNYAIGITGDKNEIDRYINYVLNGDFDIITFFAAQHWGTDLILPFLDRLKTKKIFVPTGFSGLYIPLYREYFNKMGEWIKNFDCNIFLSNDYKDINFVRDLNITSDKIVIIPNGASKYEFLGESKQDIRKKLSIPKEASLILSVGSHTALKGHSEIIKILKKTKIKNIHFVIVANKIEKFKLDFSFKNLIRLILHKFFNKNIGRGCELVCARSMTKFNRSIFRIFDRKRLLITTLSREDTVDLYKSADIFIFPSNIECSPIVLFESCASKTPFIVSDVGNSKEIVEWTNGGLLIPTRIDKRGLSHIKIKDGVKILEKLYFDEDLRQNLASNGYKSWLNNFTWEDISKKYETLYLNLLR